MEEKKYFHLIDDSEIEELVKEGRDWGYVREHYNQPKWCTYNNALDFTMGCWSLTDFKLRHKISKEYCKTCPCFKQEAKNN